MRDLLVIGGGPSGLAAAIWAARARWEVAIAEPRQGPIDKACGEGLMPPAVRALEQLGVRPSTASPFRGIRYIQGHTIATASFEGVGLGVRRLVLHAELMKQVRSLGIELLPRRIEAVQQCADRVRCDELEARWVIAADGLHSPTRAALGLSRPAKRRARFGVRRHFRVDRALAWVDVHWSQVAEAYVTPVSSDEVGVAFLYWSDRLPSPPGMGGSVYQRLMRWFPELSETLGEPRSKVRGAGPFEQRVSSPVAGRVLLVGDAAGYLDPITGEGLRLGFESARSAVECLTAGTPEAYHRRWRQILRRYWWMTSALLGLARPPGIRRRLVPALAAAPSLMSATLGLLANDGAASR